jgi:hypothetical protein
VKLLHEAVLDDQQSMEATVVGSGALRSGAHMTATADLHAAVVSHTCAMAAADVAGSTAGHLLMMPQAALPKFC